ncbi:tRNA-2-methylthio-N(6)-dimethylallyladenosine synthase-like [Ylistrum balloti]|uniref:tRNA-2-methylthio-N(6)-dimethylallyladenosine synthase-like n=1 Tax=Ylistrum balloti TaxID=509963 RepID=UPI00290580FD|nr:tRNA-2-methylthio-N(6)-dimethylallyladenosine synthase-like [Ylistrum balloti]
MTEKRQYFIQTYGCQMNVRDSELVAAQFESLGMSAAVDKAEADVVFVNTCSVRDKAEQKLYSDLGRLKQWKQNTKKIIVGGCVAQQERQRIAKRAPYVDLVIGTHQVRDISRHVIDSEMAADTQIRTDWKHDDPYQRLGKPDPIVTCKPSVFVTIQEGCDNVCTFCIVPFTRGREVSRPPEAILSEIESYVKLGAKEVVLLGQNVNSYGHKFSEFPTFAELLAQVHQIKGIQRIRFTSPHPKDYGPDVIEAYQNLPKLCPSAHLPLQAGSDAVLKAMGRGYTSQQYLDIVADLRRARPDIHFSTDIIVGFPGETRQDFEQTLEVMETVRFSQIYAFVFSPRPMTPAHKLKDKIDLQEKKMWLQELFEQQQKIQTEDQQYFLNKQVKVLWTEVHDGMLKGRSAQGRVVHALGEDKHIGEIDDVKIERATANALYGYLVPARNH